LSHEGTKGIATLYVVRCGECDAEGHVTKGFRACPTSLPIANKEAAGRLFSAWGWAKGNGDGNWTCPGCLTRQSRQRKKERDQREGDQT
jgi:hypothetical protein